MLEQTLGQLLSGQHGGAHAAGMPLGQHSPGQVMPIFLFFPAEFAKREVVFSTPCVDMGIEAGGTKCVDDSCDAWTVRFGEC